MVPSPGFAIIQSLSARRAWIEIVMRVRLPAAPPVVALRKESVDRNSWAARARVAQYCVALRKESVDRNINNNALHITALCRSPQGERG